MDTSEECPKCNQCVCGANQGPFFFLYLGRDRKRGRRRAQAHTHTRKPQERAFEFKLPLLQPSTLKGPERCAVYAVPSTIGMEGAWPNRHGMQHCGLHSPKGEAMPLDDAVKDVCVNSTVLYSRVECTLLHMLSGSGNSSRLASHLWCHQLPCPPLSQYHQSLTVRARLPC